MKKVESGLPEVQNGKMKQGTTLFRNRLGAEGSNAVPLSLKSGAQ
jgi:hypothetical protein